MNAASLLPKALAALGLMFVGQSAACGGASPVPSAPSQAPEEPASPEDAYGVGAYPQPAQPSPDVGGGELSPTDLESHEARLAQGEEEIDEALGGTAESAAQPLDSGVCERVLCRALASMKESVEGICRLSEEDAQRCDRARERLSKSEDRVEKAGCECAA